MDKDKIIKEESDNLGNVIKYLVDFDAEQRKIISSEIVSGEMMHKELEAHKNEINSKYMKLAEEKLSVLEKSENERADKAINAARIAAEKNISELEKTAVANSDRWIKEIYDRTVSGI